MVRHESFDRFLQVLVAFMSSFYRAHIFADGWQPLRILRDASIKPIDPTGYSKSLNQPESPEQQRRDSDHQQHKFTPRFVRLWGTENVLFQLLCSFMHFLHMTCVGEVVHHHVEPVLEHFELVVMVYDGVDKALVSILISLIIFFV